jgi:hypothetical protein
VHKAFLDGGIADRAVSDPEDVAKLLNRFGRRIATLTALSIEYPVGRSGARFEARLEADALYNLDTGQLGFFVMQDDEGDRFAAMIDHVAPSDADPRWSVIRGVLVADGLNPRFDL